MVERWYVYSVNLSDNKYTGGNETVVMASDYDALEARLREAVDLLHKDLGAYKSEMPHMAAEIEDFLTRYEADHETAR